MNLEKVWARIVDSLNNLNFSWGPKRLNQIAEVSLLEAEEVVP